MNKLTITNTVIILPHLKCGGTERFAAELANFIAQRDEKVTLVLMFRKEIFYDIIPRVAVIQPDIQPEGMSQVLKLFSSIRFIRSTIIRLKPDVVLALGYIALTLIASVGLTTKVIMSYRSNPERRRFPDNNILNSIYKLTYFLLRGRVNGIIAQTEAAADIYRRKYSCPVAAIPNFLRELKHYEFEKNNTIINVGHLTSDKAQHFLIEAFSMLDAPDWTLLLVGEGPRHKRLMELCIELKVDSRVHFVEYQKDIDIYLSSSRIFAFTSIIEGYPNALIEAMGTPLPVVSFDCNYGPSEIINDGVNGFLVKVGDTGILAKKLQFLIDNPSAREAFMQEAIKIRQDNHINVVGTKYLDFLKIIAINQL